MPTFEEYQNSRTSFKNMPTMPIVGQIEFWSTVYFEINEHTYYKFYVPSLYVTPKPSSDVRSEKKPAPEALQPLTDGTNLKRRITDIS